MLKLGITSHEENEAAALALAEAVSMNAAAWNYIYVHMLAAALRYMLPMMHRIPRSAKPGEIVGSGWRLVATIRTAKEHTDFRKLLQEKLSTDNQDILTDDQWRATARLAAILVIFVTLVSRIDDESFTRIQREDFLQDHIQGFGRYAVVSAPTFGRYRATIGEISNCDFFGNSVQAEQENWQQKTNFRTIKLHYCPKEHEDSVQIAEIIRLEKRAIYPW